jgi:ribosomal protein S18 acetylase RimI-like enzyme
MELRPLTDADLPAVARLHCLAFPDSTFTRLGPAAARAHYAAQLSSPGMVGLAAVRDGRLAGFCVAGRLAGSERAALLRRHGPRLALCALRRPWVLLHLLGALARRASRPAAAPAPRTFDIQAIAVLPGVRRAGVGRALMQKAEAAARRQGHARLGLAVYRRREEVARFYEALGWRRMSPWQGRMVKDLTDLR